MWTDVIVRPIPSWNASPVRLTEVNNDHWPDETTPCLWEELPVTHFNSQTSVLRFVKPSCKVLLCAITHSSSGLSHLHPYISHRRMRSLSHALASSLQLFVKLPSASRPADSPLSTYLYSGVYSGIYICATSLFIKALLICLQTCFPPYIFPLMLFYIQTKVGQICYAWECEMWDCRKTVESAESKISGPKKLSVYFTVLQLHSWPDEILRYVFIKKNKKN